MGLQWAAPSLWYPALAGYCSLSSLILEAEQVSEEIYGALMDVLDWHGRTQRLAHASTQRYSWESEEQGGLFVRKQWKTSRSVSKMWPGMHKHNSLFLSF